MTLILAPDVHLAAAEDDLVFLDVRSDSYLCLAAQDAAAVLHDLSDDATPSSPTTAELVSAGLLERSETAGRWMPFSRVPPHLEHDFLGAPPADVLTFENIAALGGSAARTAWFRARSIRHWVAHRTRSGGPEIGPDGSIEEATHRFDLLRPFIPRTGRCLPGSMLLADFLYRKGHATEVVFGVRVHPFEAHCWVECDGRVLNDTIEHVRWYTPIAAF